MTRHELWTAILDLSLDIDRLVAGEVGDLPNRRPLPNAPLRSPAARLETAWRDLRVEPSAGEAAHAGRIEPLEERDHERLSGLREAVRKRLEALWAVMGDQLGFERMRRALVIHFDERIMRLLPEYLRLGWPLLQTDITRSTVGGSEFFGAIEDALHDPRTPPQVFEVYYYCLSHGFVGMFATDPAQLQAYRIRLAERIPHPDAIVAPPGAESGELPQPWARWRYHALGLAVVVAFAWLLTALSNHAVGELW